MSSSHPMSCVCESELIELVAELTEVAQKLSELSLPKQCSRNSVPPISHNCQGSGVCLRIYDPSFLCNSVTLRAMRDIWLPRGKNCLPIVLRPFLTRNYTRPSCLLKLFPSCLSPTQEGFQPFVEITPVVREISRQLRSKSCLAASVVSSGPLGRKSPQNAEKIA